MYNLDEEKIECLLGNMEFCFSSWQESREFCVFIYDVGTRGIYSCPTLGTAKFKQQDQS